MTLGKPQGRLGNKFKLLDIGAALVILFIIFSLFFWPGPGGTAVVQIGTTTKLIEFDVAVLGLNDLHPQANFKVGEKAKLTIQNQPSGEVTIQSVKVLPRTVWYETQILLNAYCRQLRIAIKIFRMAWKL